MRKDRLYLPRIREMRLGLGLTQMQLCEAIEWPRSSYSRFENGDRPVPIEFINILCRFYKVSPDYILETAVWVGGAACG